MADTAGREGESLYFFSDCYNFLYKYKERQGEIYYVFIFAFGITFFFFFFVLVERRGLEGCAARGPGAAGPPGRGRRGPNPALPRAPPLPNR